MVRLELYEGLHYSGVANRNTRILIEAQNEIKPPSARIRVIDQDTVVTYKWELTETDLENLVDEAQGALDKLRRMKRKG